MKAVLCTGYGSPDVLQLGEVPKPIPGPREILVQIRVTTVSTGDVRIRSFAVPRWQWLFARLYLGIWKPRNPVLGMEVAGVVERVGNDVSRFAVGDRVFGATMWSGFGGYAEYVCLPEDTAVARIPDQVSFDQAAPVVGGALTALIILEKASIRPGQRVLVYGASGAVGTYATQLARHLGATVTGVCSTSNLEMVANLGANQVLDYTREDFVAKGEQYDVIFDAVDKLDESHARTALRPTGTYLNVLSSSGGMGTGREHGERVARLAELLASGVLKTVVDRTVTLENVAQAHAYVEAGHKRGNVIVTVR